MHSLLERQLRKITSRKGITDYDRLISLVDLAYEEHDRARRLQERVMQLMSTELSEANAAIRKESGEMVAESQKRFELAVEGANDGIWDWKVPGDTLWFSARCKAILGYGAEQLKECRINDWYRLVHPEDLEKAKQFIADNINKYERNVITLRFNHALAGIRYIMCRVSALQDDSGSVARLVGAHTDITDIITMQEELKEARDRSDKASRSKSDFLANMSHEIRTPMNSIMGMTNLLLETRLDQRQLLWAKIVKNSSESLLDIINDILDISKIEEDKLKLEHISFDLCEVIEQATDTLLFKAQEKNIGLLTSYHSLAPRFFIGDPGRIRQILINLMGNAIKFTEKGHVTISVSPGDTPADTGNLHFEVEDTGIGIPADKTEYIFEKFSQAEESTTRKFGGTGLGLAICRRLVKMMGDDIGVKSTLGKGSVFYFNIRLEVDTAAASQHLKSPQQGKQQKKQDISYKHLRVLVVEDMQANQIYLQTLLEKHKCTVDLAENGAQAVEKVKKKTFDILFMDCQMPEMDGFEATGAIRALPLPKQPFIIALTADAMQGDRERCLKAGMDDYLNKPVKAEKISAVLRQYVEKAG